MTIGIIGCGMIAQSHAAVLHKLFGRTLDLRLCDSDLSRATDLAQRFPATMVTSNLDELLESPVLTAVHILTPLSSHAALAAKALQAGCHVYLEKPATPSVADYQRLYSLAQEKRRRLYVGYSMLGMPTVREAKRIMATAELGQIIAVHCDFVLPYPGQTIPYGNPSHWSYSMPGGVLQNQADHPASLVVDALDEIQEKSVLFCSRKLLPNDCHDFMHVGVRSSSQIGSFSLSVANGCAQKQVTYFLEGGIVAVDLGRFLMSVIKGSGQQNIFKRLGSGLSVGAGLIGGTLTNIYRMLRGKLGRDPGISALVSDFYAHLDTSEEGLVSHRTVLGVCSLLEETWSHLGVDSYREDPKGLATGGSGAVS